jgi:hypothetical protein
LDLPNLIEERVVLARQRENAFECGWNTFRKRGPQEDGPFVGRTRHHFAGW